MYVYYILQPWRGESLALYFPEQEFSDVQQSYMYCLCGAVELGSVAATSSVNITCYEISAKNL